MSLPDGFLDELRARVSITDVIGRKVIWDSRKSVPSKGDMWAPCPFHQEKTASFHVDDKKGYYYCFGCQAKGDAIGFLRETENMSFMEAVELLAREAGMEMPARDPRAQARAEAGARLAEIMEMAVQYYRLCLNSGAGALAREYLRSRRGLDEAAQNLWEIGFAPEGWQGLWDHLQAKNVPGEKIIEAGLAKASNRGGKPYDVFRNRIMFPIRDARGRAIAFGGRAMDPNDNAKYLNSPETPLFDKGRSLYNQGPARAASGKGAPLLVAEGYMDVIALAEAGFAATVAPLGTAITERQLALLWRISPEPVIALDGDKAGLRAAMKLIDLALPRLEAGRSLRFCLLPEGQDPDDLIRAKGAAAMEERVAQARPLSALLWQRETEGQVFDSPERRAALDRRLRGLLGKIPDPDVRNHYGTEFKRLRGELFGTGPARRVPFRGKPVAGAGGPTPGTRQSLLAGQDAGGRLREAVILALLLRHPVLVTEHEDALERLAPQEEEHQMLAQALMRCHADTGAAAWEEIAGQLGAPLLERLMAAPHVRLVTDLHVAGDLDRARACLAEEWAKLESDRGLRDEVAEAAADPDPRHEEHIKWRLGQAVQTRNSAVRALAEDQTEYVKGPNGAHLNKDERDELRQLLEKISKPSGN
ncbi:MAG: DNA primase [Mangrovicoccus sp.]|nr:DNA primase [Mangrovicoccus sp.]